MGVSRRVLLVTLYYPPDLSACAFRAGALVRALRDVAPDVAVDVVTSVPHRYASFARRAEAHEEDGRLTIDRLPMPSHRSDMISQALAYTAFARSVRTHLRGRRYDGVVATSSRLMTAALGVHVAGRMGAPVYLDVRDLFADAMKEVLPAGIGTALSPLLSLIEHRTLSRAAHINLVSPGFEAYVRARYPSRPLSWFTNGIDDEFLQPAVPPPVRADGVRTIVYAGNIGEGQGLHAVVPALAVALAGRARFRIIGDGGRRAALHEALRTAGAPDVTLLPPMPRAQLIEEYQAADALFLHLNDYEAFTRVLPSKLFEYAAMGRPVWAGVRGVAETFLREQVPNAAVFAPCDERGAVTAFAQLRWELTPRTEFVARYTRSAVMRAMAKDILRVFAA